MGADDLVQTKLLQENMQLAGLSSIYRRPSARARQLTSSASFNAELGPPPWRGISSALTYMVVDGRRFDTSARSQTGSRWSNGGRGGGGYVVRHPAGY